MPSSVHTLYLYGSRNARAAAKSMLENQPEIRRLDSLQEERCLRLILSAPLHENSLITLLAKSGISGFRLV